jgi:hypothetical protein
LVPPFERSAATGLFALPAAALAVLLALFGRLRARSLLILFTAIVAADVLWIDHTLVEGRSRREWLDPYRALAEYLKDAGAIRVYSPSYSLPQQAAAYWEIPQFGGIDPFQFAGYVQAAEAATGVRASGYSVTIPDFAVEDDRDLPTANRDAPLSAALLGQWLVTHVVAGFEIKAEGLEFERKLGDVYIYHNTLAPPVRLAWDGPNRVAVHAEQPYQGTLYAVANGRWKGPQRTPPGLPGAVDGSARNWTYAYSASEITSGLLAGAILMLLAAGAGWGARHV